MNSKLINKFKILTILVVSFFAVRYLSPSVFLGNTKKINPNLAVNIKNLARAPINLLAKLRLQLGGGQKDSKIKVASLDPKAKPITDTDLKDVIFTQVAKGAYAGESRSTGKKYVIYDNNVKINVREFIINGEKFYYYEPEITPMP